jgi:hypothetical protein
MCAYIDNGCRLGWLIMPKIRQVEIDWSEHPTVEVLESPDLLSGEDILPGLVVNPPLNRGQLLDANPKIMQSF